MFRVGDKIVHPMHGAGSVEEIVTRKVDGVLREYYILRLPMGGMTVMVPTANCADIGVRPVLSPAEAEGVLETIRRLEVTVEPNWNQRYRENMLRLKSGDLIQVAKVVKGLMARDARRGLSTGERKMLHTARQIITSEIAMALDLTWEAAAERMDGALGA